MVSDPFSSRPTNESSVANNGKYTTEKDTSRAIVGYVPRYRPAMPLSLSRLIVNCVAVSFLPAMNNENQNLFITGRASGILHLYFEQFHRRCDDDLAKASTATGYHLTVDGQIAA